MPVDDILEKWLSEAGEVHACARLDKEPLDAMRILVAGWFSFKDGHATAGDVLARDLTCQWIEAVPCPYDVALDKPFKGGVNWRKVNPQSYSHVIFVCGPFSNGPLEQSFLARFWRCRLIGLNLSMLTPLDRWNPFDLLIERDSSAGGHPDFVIASRQRLVPIAGVCLVEDYPGADNDVANAAIRRLTDSNRVATIAIDTRLDTNSTGFRDEAEVESIIARLDVMITTRLHGMILALKNGVPAIAIDPEPNGAKILRQAQTLNWPVVFKISDLDGAELQQALDYCLTPEARAKARSCAKEGEIVVRQLSHSFIKAFRYPDDLEASFMRRLRQ